MFSFPAPNQQIAFSIALTEARQQYLQEALARALETSDLEVIDRELVHLAPRPVLNALARQGLRGELLFAVPALLRANPRLIAYYRLLLGYSQKEFFTAATGAACYKTAESEGRLTAKAAQGLEDYCRTLNVEAGKLAAAIGAERLSRELLDDLSLLTLGPQLRGGANVRKGDTAIVQVFEVIHGIVGKAVIATTDKQITIKNAARRIVLIEFASDPDIIIREQMKGGEFRNKVAIEVKGGTDFSNIHNRLGEAEKSHRKARESGYTECWTVINVPGMDEVLAKTESPSTDRFYCLAELLQARSVAFREFRDQILSLTAISD